MIRHKPPAGPAASAFAKLLVLALIATATTVASVSNARAFTPETRIEIVRRAASLMPSSLQRQLERHVRPLYSGALETMEEGERSKAHTFEPGSVDASLAAAVTSAKEAVDSQRPMAIVAHRLGRVAHAAADLSFALNVGEDAAREDEIYEDFGEYVEGVLPKLRITFAGFRDGDLAAGDVDGFAGRVASDARRDYEAILRSYFPEGRRPTTQDFDERSIPFAIASLEVSLAVNTTARAWLYTWHQAHGDLEGAAAGLTNGVDPFGPPRAVRSSAVSESTDSTDSETRGFQEEDDESE